MDKKRLYKENGEPRFIRCYEAKRLNAMDKFTVVFTRATIWGGKKYQGRVFYVGMSANPFSPLGFCQHGEAWLRKFCPGGSRIAFAELPKDCQAQVLDDYESLWEGKQ